MSVLIKGIDIPTNCFQCRFMLFRRYCLINKSIFFDDEGYSELKGRYKGCPLVEISTPRGRLIDVDKLTNEIDSLGNYNDFVQIFDVTEKIREAPTIIEAENQK